MANFSFKIQQSTCFAPTYVANSKEKQKNKHKTNIKICTPKKNHNNHQQFKFSQENL